MSPARVPLAEGALVAASGAPTETRKSLNLKRMAGIGKQSGRVDRSLEFG